jgi:hypothetical protein
MAPFATFYALLDMPCLTYCTAVHDSLEPSFKNKKSPACYISLLTPGSLFVCSRFVCYSKQYPFFMPNG